MWVGDGWLKHGVGDPGERGMNAISAIKFSCTAIHFPIVYNLQFHQMPVPLIACVYGIGD